MFDIAARKSIAAGRDDASPQYLTLAAPAVASHSLARSLARSRNQQTVRPSARDNAMSLLLTTPIDHVSGAAVTTVSVWGVGSLLVTRRRVAVNGGREGEGGGERAGEVGGGPDERLESSYVSTARRCYDLTDCAKQLPRHPPHIGNRCQTSTLTWHINLLR